MLAALALAPAVLAFPPAPHHTLYGVVRNEMGEPIRATDAVVVLETVTGVRLKTAVVPLLAPGVNYRLKVPMDAGLTPDNYRPTALRPSVSFRMKVLIGGATYLPIETSANYANLGKPAQTTRLDLTLGEDSDNDGLPDAWERALMDMLGGGLAVTDIEPGADADGDGMSNLHEYLAGTYAFDPQDGFRLDILGTNVEHPVFEFLAIRGRAYTLEGSADLLTWELLPFRIASSNPVGSWRKSYSASDVRVLRIEADIPSAHPYQVFRLRAE